MSDDVRHGDMGEVYDGPVIEPVEQFGPSEQDERRETICTADFPCAANIFVLAAIDPACPTCAPHIPQMRAICGCEPAGKYFTVPNITAEQQAMIAERIEEAS